MNYKQSSKQILKNVGGKENVLGLTHCATRLRFNLKNEALFNEDEIKTIQGVLGVKSVGGGQSQVIVGQDVSNYYNELTLLLGEDTAGGSIDVVEVEDYKKKFSFTGVLDTISGIFTPILPAITGAALIKTLLILLTMWGWLDNSGTTYKFLSLVGDTPFYFLPIMLAYSAAQKFKMNPMIGMTMGLMMIHPTYLSMVTDKVPVTFLNLPVILATYTSTVIPVILVVWAASYVEKYVDKITPKAVKFFLKPFITLLIMAPLAFIVIGPLGTIAGNGLGSVLSTIQTQAPWSLPLIFGIIAPLVIMFGMHYVVTIPLVMTAIAVNGFDMIGPGFLVSNLAQTGACLAVALLAKKQDFKALATSAGITALIGGIVEPAMYGVNLKLRKPFIASMIGGGIGGLVCGLTGVKRVVFGPTGLMTLPIFIDPNNNLNFPFAIVGIAVSFIISFGLTFYFVKTDPKIREQI